MAPDLRPDPEEREFFTYRGMNALWLIASLALTAFAVFATIQGPSGESELVTALCRVLMGVVAAFSVTVTARVLARVKEAPPLLRFDADGITDRSALGPPVFVPWDEIVSLRRGPGANGGIEIEVKDPAALKLGWVRRFNTRVLRRLRDADLVLPASGLDVPSDEVIALAHAWTESRLLGEVRASAARLEAPTDGPEA